MLKVTAKKVTVCLLVAFYCGINDVITAQADPSTGTDDDMESQVNWSPGDPRWCLQSMWKVEEPESRTQLFEILPGLGWDNLVNTESAPVLLYNYSKCRLTDDGKFLIPDNVFIIPLKRSKLQSFAELIDEWKDLKSKTARTINMNPGFSIASYSISGKFSREYAQVKGKQIEDKSATIRIQLRYHRYKAKLRPGSSLSPEFKASLLNIAAHLVMGQMDRARYESEVLIRYFGTHYLTSVTAGAALVKEDYIKRSYLEDHRDDRTGMLSSASGTFQETFSLNMAFGENTRDQTTTNDAYRSNLTHAYTETLGGDVFLSGGMTAREWAKDLDSNLVAMDRAGEPLYLLITQKTLPELPLSTVEMLEAYVRAAFNLYYQMNVIPGCTDRTFAKFSITANFDDGSCKTQAVTGLALGGMYQTCEPHGDDLTNDPCVGAERLNALTGKLACPGGFTAVLLHEGDGPYQNEYIQKCDWCNIVSKCCNTKQLVGYPHFQTYWCAGQADKLHSEAGSDVKPDTGPGAVQGLRGKRDTSGQPKPAVALQTAVNSGTTGQRASAAVVKTKPASDRLGYSFGGVFTSTTDNLVTNTRTCPEGFNPLKVFFDLKVCISDDEESTNHVSVPFGGFFSCSTGNPLAAADSELERRGNARPIEMLLAKSKSSPGKWPKKCPIGYSQHLAIEVNGCAIHYCAESGSMRATELPNVRRPPFSLEPPETASGPELVFDKASMTWVAKSNVQYGQQKDQKTADLKNSSGIQALQNAVLMPNPSVGIQRASGSGEGHKDGYIEMKSEVFVGIIVCCVSLVALTIGISVYIVRRRTAEDEMLPTVVSTEGTPLRSSGGLVNAAFQPNENLSTGSGDFGRASYSSPTTDFQ